MSAYHGEGEAAAGLDGDRKNEGVWSYKSVCISGQENTKLQQAIWGLSRKLVRRMVLNSYELER